MNKLTTSALGLSLMIGSAFAAAPPQAASTTPKTSVKKAVRVKKTPHAVTSAANPKPVVVK